MNSNAIFCYSALNKKKKLNKLFLFTHEPFNYEINLTFSLISNKTVWKLTQY